MTGQQQQKKQSNENDTVNINCDSSDYLIVVNETNRNEVAVVMADDEPKKRVQEEAAAEEGDERWLLHKAKIADQILASKNTTKILQTPLRSVHRHRQQDSNETMFNEDGNEKTSSSVLGNGETKARNSSPAFVTFDELVRLCELQTSRSPPVSTVVRLRLCGGGEESINNGTSAWGTPTVTNNPAGSSWGAINSQQTTNASAVGSSTSSSSGSTQQQAQAATGTGTSAWGGAGAGGPGSNNAGGGGAGVVTPGNGGSNGQQPPKGPNGGMEGGGSTWNGPGAGASSVTAGSAQSNASASGGPASAPNSANLEQQQQQQPGGGPAAQPAPANAQQQQVEGLAQGVAVAAGGVAGAAVQSSTAKNQLEQLNSLREALFAQDGWGSENVDQDTQWDVPASPEPGGKTDPNSATSGPMAGIPMWKTNTGTELWEANLRNGGQLPQQQPPVSKTWGPQNNYGGTWGEDDEGNEPGSVWNGAGGGGGGAGPMGPGGAVGVGGLRDPVAGVAGMMGGPQQQQQQQQAQSQPPWNSGGGGGALGGAGGPGLGVMWGGGPGVANVGAGAGGGVVGLKKDGNDWGSAAAAGGAGAGAPGWSGEGRGVSNPAAVVASVPAVAGGASGGGLDASGIDMRNMRIASAMDSNREIRGDPRGISGRLNGNVGLWDQHQMSAMQPKMPPTVTTPGTAGPGGNGGAQWPGGPNNNPLAGVNNGAGGGGGGGVGKIGSSGWDDLSGGGAGGPPGVRRNMDDGTALWGQNALNRQNSGNAVVSGGGGGGGWKDGSGNDGGMGRSAGMHRNAMMGSGGGGLVGRMNAGGASGGPVGGGPMKPDNLWGQNPNRGVGNWGAGGGADDPSNTGNWDDKSGGVGGGMGANSLWNDGASIAGVAAGGNGGGGWNKGKGGSGWNDASGVPGGAGTMDISEWGMPPNKPPSKMELLRCSKQYRTLCEHGFKKEDVENVLRMTNMNMEESLELLNRNSAGGAGINDWRRSDNHGTGAFGDQFIGSGAGGTGGTGGVSGRFAAAAAGIGPMAFQNNQNNLGGGGGVFGGGNGPAAGGAGSFNNMKFGGAGGPGGNGPPGGFGQPLGGGSGSVAGGLNQPNAQSQQISNHQLRVLVQQIQLAVQNGYLDHQILNQPLAPQTLMLLNQLLNHIKQLHLMQNNLARTGGGGVNAVQMSLAINKLKSQITSLQSQIATQQSIYLKQHQQQQPHQQQQQSGHPGAVNNVNVAALAAATGGHPGNDLFRNASDMSGLPGAFGDLALKDSGPPFPSSTGSTSQQSRLNQWKLPAATTPTTPGGLDKDVSDLNDFVRAPGATSKSSGPSGSSGIDDSPWSNGRSNLGDSGWPDSSVQDNKDWPGGNDAFSDLVPEFEPGKPWKGTQATRIEDDPTITPGSVARNSLSIAAAKESNLFGGSSGGGAGSNVSNMNSKSSPTESTWSFNPSGTSGNGGGGGGMQNSGHYGGSNTKVPKNPWQDSGTPTMQPSDLAWDSGLGGGKARTGTMMGGGALGKQGGGSKLVEANGWNTSSSAQGGSSWNSGSNSSWASTWILLRNLTAQIDGSTLRTLCMQHGPLLNFQSYTHHSVALCKYATREEAQKAQQALNNCPLGNTTICAEIPTESDVQYILSQLGGSMNASNGMTNGLTGAASGGGQNWRLVAAQQSQPSVSRSNSVVADAWSSSAWGSGNAGPSLWPTMDGGPADRGTPANLNSLLPESLLGSELN